MALRWHFFCGLGALPCYRQCVLQAGVWGKCQNWCQREWSAFNWPQNYGMWAAVTKRQRKRCRERGRGEGEWHRKQWEATVMCCGSCHCFHSPPSQKIVTYPFSQIADFGSNRETFYFEVRPEELQVENGAKSLFFKSKKPNRLYQVKSRQVMYQCHVTERMTAMSFINTCNNSNNTRPRRHKRSDNTSFSLALLTPSLTHCRLNWLMTLSVIGWKNCTDKRRRKRLQTRRAGRRERKSAFWITLSCKQHEHWQKKSPWHEEQ